jgi:hypothetical protein
MKSLDNIKGLRAERANIATARAPAGFMMDTERARLLAPAAFSALKASVAADDVAVPGL